MPSPHKTLQEGNLAPLFELEDFKGTTYALSDFIGKKKVVLYFYPKDLTPGCTTQACDFSKQLTDFNKKKAVVIGISLDPPNRHQKFIEKYQLKHILLSDEDHKICEQYGVYQEKSLYGKKFMGIVRTTFVIGLDGKIKKVFPKVKVTDHWKEVLELL
ncbi:MAG: thioredoxin-dependent thiol peroxidase [Deltaproteobacteria bacterium]|nr:thioredoxin-dependent thiol peroxidase [Deltaproteobacteria bacterium]